MRVGFTLIGGREWTGGYNYLLNLLRVLHGHPECGIEPVLFVGHQVTADHLAPFLPYLRDAPFRHAAFERRLSAQQLLRACTLGNVPSVARLFRAQQIGVVFEAAQFYGWRFPLPTIAWTPDFQHHHLPGMFSRRAWLRRELGYRAQVAGGRTLMLSSEDARRDSELYYPGSVGRTVVVRFAVLPPDASSSSGPELLARHGLPPRFLYLPNQFWKHKNHVVVIDALALLKQRGEHITVAASGNPSDTRHADHYRNLVDRVQRLGVEAEFRFLGMLPYEEVIGLTTQCHALVNPSFFEGWSTTVEEAKSLGARLVLSDLAAHREQAGEQAIYFDASSAASAANALLAAWRHEDPVNAEERRQRASLGAQSRVREFAAAFASAAKMAAELWRARQRRAFGHAVSVIENSRRRGKGLKVLLGHNFYRSITPGGEDVAFRQERDLLAAAGVDIVTYTRSNDDVDERNRVQAARTAREMPWSKTTYDDIHNLILRERPDVAHFHNTFPLISPSAYAACQDLGVPVVQTLHNYRLVCCAGTFFRDGKVCVECTAASPWPGVRHRCYRGSLPGSLAVAWMLQSNWRRGTYTELVDVYVALTQFAADRFAAQGLPRERIVISPNFVDSLDPPNLGGGGYVAFAGRLSEEKGVRVVLDAWRELRDIPLKVVGDGPMAADFARAAREANLPIEFLGMRPRNEVLQIIGGAEFQVVASECFEGFPLVVVESYARGTPVIASHIGGLIELISPEQTGLHFDVGDPAALVRQVRRLWGDAPLRARLRAGARARYEAEYTPERATTRLLDLYARALASAAQRKPLQAAS